MLIIDRSLILETFKALLLILLVLLLLILTNTLVIFLSEVASGRISLKIMGLLLGVQAIKLTGFILPPAFFFAILWVLGRSYRENEIIAWQSAGFSLMRIYRPFFILSWPLALFVALLTLWLYPEIRGYIDRIQQEEQKKIQIEGLKMGEFNRLKSGLIVYVGEISPDQKTIHNIFVRYSHPQSLIDVLVAQTARIEHRAQGRFLVLIQGHRYQGNPGKQIFNLYSFQEYGIRLPDSPLDQVNLSRSALPSSLLWASSNIKLKAELQRRLAAPLSVWILMVVALVMAYSSPRQSPYGRLLLAILIYALYLNLLQLAVKWMGSGRTPALLGIWWVPGLTLLLAAMIQYWYSLARYAHQRRWHAQNN